MSWLSEMKEEPQAMRRPSPTLNVVLNRLQLIPLGVRRIMARRIAWISGSSDRSVNRTG